MLFRCFRCKSNQYVIVMGNCFTKPSPEIFNRGALRFCGEALGLCGWAWHPKIGKSYTDI